MILCGKMNSVDKTSIVFRMMLVDAEYEALYRPGTVRTR